MPARGPLLMLRIARSNADRRFTWCSAGRGAAATAADEAAADEAADDEAADDDVTEDVAARAGPAVAIAATVTLTENSARGFTTTSFVRDPEVHQN